jgi:hypothetical protein
MSSVSIRLKKFKKLWPTIVREVEELTCEPFPTHLEAILVFPTLRGIFELEPELYARCQSKSLTLDDLRHLPAELRPPPHLCTQEQLNRLQRLFKRVSYIFGPHGTKTKWKSSYTDVVDNSSDDDNGDNNNNGTVIQL